LGRHFAPTATNMMASGAMVKARRRILFNMDIGTSFRDPSIDAQRTGRNGREARTLIAAVDPA